MLLTIKKGIFFLLLGLHSTSSASDGQKFVIGVQKTWGFFADFFSTIHNVQACTENNLIPVVLWDSECLYYQPQGYNNSFNAWEYYFEPISSLSYQPGDAISRVHCLSAKNNSFYNVFCVADYSCQGHVERKAANDLICKHVKLKPHIQNKVNEFYTKNIEGKKTIGIHLRGTDKHTEIKPTPAMEILTKANEYKDYQYFVATDEQALLELAKKVLNGPVIYYDSLRSADNNPIHFGSIDKAKAGEEVLIEVLLLSKCDKFIHTHSNVSIAVLCFNPQLESIFFAP